MEEQFQKVDGVDKVEGVEVEHGPSFAGAASEGAPASKGDEDGTVSEAVEVEHGPARTDTDLHGPDGDGEETGAPALEGAVEVEHGPSFAGAASEGAPHSKGDEDGTVVEEGHGPARTDTDLHGPDGDGEETGAPTLEGAVEVEHGPARTDTDLHGPDGDGVFDAAALGNTTLVGLGEMARRLRMSSEGFRRLVHKRRIPHLDTGRDFKFDPLVVVRTMQRNVAWVSHEKSVPRG